MPRNGDRALSVPATVGACSGAAAEDIMTV